MAKKKPVPQPYAKPDQIQIRGNQIFSRVRQKWLIQTPEELVRQTFLDVVLNEYGFTLAQINEEAELTGRGTGHARADFVIWRTVQDKQDRKPPLIVVECKSDNVTIKPADYAQGDNYARLTNAPFFVTHNTRETRFWRVRKDRMPGYIEEIESIPHADASDKDIDDILKALKTFKEDEFAELLHKCHNVIRNREKKDPVAAFDEIAKVLFIKVHIERDLRKKRLRQNRFTEDYLKQLPGEQPLDMLFQDTKRAYASDGIFDPGETLNLKPATGLEIVRLLQSYDLSDTSEDIKGIAFERFLGRTFRGEIGQFFTPRCIVEFMVRTVEPKEGEVICDPASGSGGFLIRFFEIVREQILADADRQYQDYKAQLDGKKNLTEAKRAELLRARFDAIQRELDQTVKDSRLWKLANCCIYGTDANDRMARTSKMNMIMHGDGHGGVHHHDGFLNVNGIFEGRFDIILTNPPFGANVEPSDVITEEQVAVTANEDAYVREFGDLYRQAQARVRAAVGQPIARLFELPKRGDGTERERARRGMTGKIKTEILFIERCLELLKPGGRLGIVLPEGVFNNPSLSYVREFCEDRAFIRAVVSLPQETFLSSGASVKASLLFLQKFTDRERARFDAEQKKTAAEIDAKYAAEITAETARLQVAIDNAKEARHADGRKTAQRALVDYERTTAEKKSAESRALLKTRFNYPIFMYEAEKVGITATGESDQNELYPNPDLPPGIEKSCVELYQEFRKDPEPFLVKGKS
jgi:type I restriction enzyme M protein